MPIFPIVLVLISACMHAGWNLLAHSLRTSRTLFLRSAILLSLVGLGPVLALELLDAPFPGQVWFLLVLAGIFQACYFTGLTMGYRSGDFTVVYPVGRALPVLFLGFIDMARGQFPSAMGWVGMVLVVAGCVLTPQQSLRQFRLLHYWNHTMIWTLVIALGVVGYTTVDKVAAEMLPEGPLMAARYGVLETAFTVPFFWLVVRYQGHSIFGDDGGASWKTAAMAATFIFGAYWLVLWAYQLSPYASYIVALRQFSIVLGVAVGATLFGEPARALRLGAAITITVGIALIVAAG